jgi:hypothetical protein
MTKKTACPIARGATDTNLKQLVPFLEGLPTEPKNSLSLWERGNQHNPKLACPFARGAAETTKKWLTNQSICNLLLFSTVSLILLNTI